MVLLWLLLLPSVGLGEPEETRPLVSLGLIAGEPSGLVAELRPFEPWGCELSLGSSFGDAAWTASLDLTYALGSILGSVSETSTGIVRFGLGARIAREPEGVAEPGRLRSGFRVPFALAFAVRGSGELAVVVAPGLLVSPDERAFVDAGLAIRVPVLW